MSPWDIRDAVASDAAAIAAIYTESIRAGDATMHTADVSSSEIRQRLERLHPDECLLVLVDSNGDVLGWGAAVRYSDRPGYGTTCETSVYLRREFVGRRLGMGSALQSALLRRCRGLGYHHVVAKVWADNPVSLAMHRKLGFHLVGIQHQVGRIRGKWIDVAILECILDSGHPGGRNT